MLKALLEAWSCGRFFLINSAAFFASKKTVLRSVRS